MPTLVPRKLPVIWWHTLDDADGEPTSASMNAPGRIGFDIETILNDLYDSEINASISWVWDGGFHATLGNPKLAEQSALPTIRDAVLWLRDAACKHLPDSDFARKYGGFV